MANAPYKIVNLGDVGWTNLNDAFKNNTQLESATIGAGINALTEMINTFAGCSNLKEINVIDWDILNITSLHNFLKDTQLTTDSYSSMLIHFANSTTINVGVVMHGGNSFFNAAGEEARDTLVNVYQWDITDAGLQPEWIQILTTDDNGNLTDLTLLSPVPTPANARMLKFLTGGDYVEIEDNMINFFNTGFIDFEFDMKRGSASTQYILDNGYKSGYNGIAIYCINNDITIYRRVSNVVDTKQMLNCLSPSSSYTTLQHIHIIGDSDGFVVTRDGIPFTYSGGFSVKTGTPAHNARLGRQIGMSDNISDYIQLGNVKIADVAYLNFEERQGLECFNTLNNTKANIVAVSDLSNIRIKYDGIESHNWKYGFNMPDEYTTYPSFSVKTTGIATIGTHDTYFIDATYDPVNGAPSYEFDVNIQSDQDFDDTVIFSAGRPYQEDSNHYSIHYKKSTGSIICRVNTGDLKVASATVNGIKPNTTYNIKMYTPNAGAWHFDIDDADHYVFTSFDSFNADRATFGMEDPEVTNIGIFNQSCKCRIFSFESKKAPLVQLDMENVVGNSFILPDLLAGNDWQIVTPDITTCWDRIEDPSGIFVDAVSHKPLKYPPCKDGILHNSADLDFKMKITSVILTEMELDVGLDNTPAGIYTYAGIYNNRPYYYHDPADPLDPRPGYCFYYAPESRWRIMAGLGTDSSGGLVHRLQYTDYPCSNAYWGSSSNTSFPSVPNILSYKKPGIIDDYGRGLDMSFNDLLALNRTDDNIIVDRHVTDTNVTVIDKMKFIK